MKVDVVICAKNQANSMERVIHQIMREVPCQNLIVIFGSSSNGTKEIAEKYANSVFWDKDKGLGTARNLGIRKATSEIVAMIDADVVLTKGWFNKLIGHFHDPKVAAVNGTCIYGFGCKPLESYWKLLSHTLANNVGCHNTLFRRDAVLKVGNFNETIEGAGEDYDLYFRLLSTGYKWIWIKDAIVLHPMGMWDFLKHVRWWSRGKTHIGQFELQVTTSSLFRVYCRLGYSIVASLWEGVKLSISVHPVFLFYFPLMNIVTVWEVFRGLRKPSNSQYVTKTYNDCNNTTQVK